MIHSFLLAVFAIAGCQTVGGDRITAKDFALAVPEFSALPEGVSLGYAPLPGAHREFTGAEIQRISAQYGIKTSFRDAVCFEWPMRRLDRSDVAKAMGEVLAGEDVRVEEFSLLPVPPGQIVFPLSGLNRQSSGMSFWRGYVLYAGDRKFNIWAKVRVGPERPGAGKPDVASGSKVVVVVRSGAAELKLEAQAISSGSVGQTITVRNPRSGRSFPAEVTGKNSVSVEAGDTHK